MAYVINSMGRSRKRCRPCSDDTMGAFDPPCTGPRACDCACRNHCLQPRSMRNVIFRGPCAPGPDTEGALERCRRRACRHRRGYGFFARVGTLTAGAGEALPLDSVVRESEGAFERENRAIEIRRPGIYLASFALTLPAGATVNTQIAMTLGGRTIPGSVVNVVKAPGSSATTFVQAMFEVTVRDERLEVRTSNALNLVGDSPLETLASLTILQLDGDRECRELEESEDRECRRLEELAESEACEACGCRCGRHGHGCCCHCDC
ncbi:MAG: hypothetical protein VB067_10405 [Christensenellaceae bacterium]|nr:hypothetical protein [Christensenellaceae bacterium]MEA5064604.1 hypothetical protein [Eubacteriales bacterium]MEA5069391.1 hypothetical protein [Christensenellaceae bacterium]